MQNVTMQFMEMMQEAARSNGRIMVEMAPTMQAKAHPFRRGASN